MSREVNFGKLLHGGDYNPEQWLHDPDILEKDIEYFKKAKINEVSLGVFSWSMLEPEEGVFRFQWMEDKRVQRRMLLSFVSGRIPKLAEGQIRQY